MDPPEDGHEYLCFRDPAVMFLVHTIVAWDFAMAIRPGCLHDLRSLFVVGALHSGLGRGCDGAVHYQPDNEKHENTSSGRNTSTGLAN